MPTRSNHTQTGNYRARYAAEFDDPSGVEFRIEFIDNDTSTAARTAFGQTSAETPHEINVTADGFVLSYDGPTDHMDAAIIPSKCQSTFIIENADHELLPIEIEDGDDGRFGLAIYKSDGTNWVPFWVGGLNHEAIEYELEDQRYLLTLSASCGLNRLQDIPFRTSSGEVYTGKESIASLIAICINKIPFADFWLSTDTQLAEVVDIYNQEGLGTWTPSDGDAFEWSVIERTMTRAETFYKRKAPFEDEYGRRIYFGHDFLSCFEVLEHIAIAFGYRIFQSEMNFWVFPPNAYNWSHTLRVQRWTRSQLETETIETAIPGGGTTYDETSTYTDTNFAVNLDTNHALEVGFANSYLLPINKTVLTHENAGQQSVFGPPRFFYIDNTTPGPQTLANTDFQVETGRTLNVRGIYDADGLHHAFGTSQNTDRVGARIVLRFKIKVGSYYYGSEYSMDTATTNINMPTGISDIDFKRIFTDTPSWSTTEKWFDVVVPWTESEPPASIESSQGWDRVGGLHIEETGTGEFDYSGNNQWDNVVHEFNFTTAPLPDVLSVYDGVEVSVDRIVVTAGGTALDDFDDLANVINGGSLVDYDEDGNTVNPLIFAPGDYVHNYFVGIGDNNEDADIVYFISQSNQIEPLDLGKTALGDSNVGGEPRTNGALWVLQPNQTSKTTTNLSDYDWLSVTEAVDANDDADALLYVRCREGLFARSKPRGVQRGTIPVQFNATNVDPLTMCNVWHHNCSTTGDVIDYLIPFRFTYNAGFGSYDADLCLLKRVRQSFTADEDRVFRNPNQGNGGISQGDNPTETMAVKVLGVVENVYDDHETDITAIQAKTNNITVTQAVNLDQLESQVGQNTFNISTNATNISNNTSSITDIATVLKSTTGGGGQGVYTDSGKATTSSYMGLTSTSAKLQAGGGNTAIDMTETSPGQISMAVQVGSTGFETSATAIDIQGTTGSQLPDITFNGNISGIDLNDLDDVNAGSPSDGQALAWNSATSKWTPQTSGGGGSMSDVVDDTTPQLGGDLDLNGNDITGTGNISTTGTLATTGIATLPGIALGTTGILGTGAIQTSSSITGNNVTATGTLSVTGNSTFSSNLYAQGIQFIGSGTNTIGPSGIAGTQDDLEIQSNGNVTVVLDYDSDESAQAFIVKNQAGTVIFQVDEDGISGGLFTSTTPTLSTISDFEASQTGTITVTNYDSNATYVVKLFNSSGTEQTAQTITDNSNGTWSITNGPVLTGAYVTIQVLEFGKLVSSTATSNSFDINAAQTQMRYWRLQMTDSSKNPTHNKVALANFRLFTATGGGGTSYPSVMTSETTPSPYVVTKGYQYSTSYPAWKAFDGSGNSASSMWWTLGLSSANASNNWVQIDLGSSIDFGSGECRIATSGGWTDANFAVLYGSNTGDFTGEEREMAFFQNIDKAGESGGTFTTYTESIT